MVIRFVGVHRAAEHMHLSQTAVTARIQKLEKSLSAKPFDRFASGMTLTKQGESLQKYAEQNLQLADLIQWEVDDPGEANLKLRIGVSETIVQSWLPEFISQLRCGLRNLEIEIAVDISANLRESLLNRSLDLAILMEPASEYTADNVELLDFPLRWYQTSDVQLASDPQKIFLSNPMVTYARNTRPYRELKTELFDLYGPGINFVLSIIGLTQALADYITWGSPRFKPCR